ncbi:MAG: efflux RND transporter periplasmic adaptor subunit [Aureibaculum sp.]|nr:efflux RND transporter periplasmic adaptor subunit [Aureibaculum sp.]
MKYINVLLFSLVLIACGKSDKQTQTKTEDQDNDSLIIINIDQFDSGKMQLGALEEQVFNETIKVNGMIDVPPQNRSSVSTFMGGYIKRTPLLVGDKVKKGQFLVAIENTDFVEIQQQYLEVAEQLTYLKSEFERQKTLFNEKITSKKNFLKSESTYKSSLALYRGLRKKLEMMNISPTSLEGGKITSVINLYAPIQGSVTKVNVSNGTYISPADQILEIVNTEHIHLELSVFEKDILKIKKDQPINFRIPEVSNDNFTAEVHLVGTSVNETDRTIKVHGHINDDKQTNFVTGMFVEAEIIISSKKSMALPTDAVVEIEDNYFVLVLENQKEDILSFTKIKLDVGNQNEEYIEVLNSIDFKDRKVLSKGAFMIVI